MQPLNYLYLDDSGARNPDWEPSCDGHKRDSFCVGGVFVREEDKYAVKAAHKKFCDAWNITYPLHSAEIRFREKNFKWLGKLEPPELQRFHNELSDMLLSIPVLGHACVVHRPGYDARYRGKYGRQTWHLCKTAFNVILERTVKLAKREGRQIIAHHELTDPGAMKRLKAYYRALKAEGPPFDEETSAKYQPLTREDFKAGLLDFSFKPKSNVLTQIADLYLYPMRRGGYDLHYRAHEALIEKRKLIDCHLQAEEIPLVGIKYSCFENVVKL